MKFISVPVLLIMALPPSAFAGEWLIESMAQSERVPCTSISMDPMNNPAVAFCEEGALKLATRDGSLWDIQDVVAESNI